jgi:hypothetical protein
VTIRNSPEPFLDHAPLPIHFRAWKGNKPYNLCDTSVAGTLWTPYRSITTCPACLEKLR